MVSAGAGTVLVGVLSRRPKEVFLAVFVLALTYNRQYFSFDGIFGPQGSNGLYWVPADLMLLLVVGTSLLESAAGTGPRLPAVGGWAGVRPVMIFLAVACVSALLANRADWAFNDTFRIAKFAFILAWLQRNITRSLWLTLVGALGASIVLQSGIGVMQVMMHADKSLLSMIGGHGNAAIDEGVGELENRARGTLGHPNYLAPYLLLLTPGAFGLALFSRRAQTKWLTVTITVVAIAGMLATQSRAPTALLALALLVVTLIAVGARALAVRSFLAGVILIALGGSVAIVLFIDRIEQRITGDLSASVEFRAEYNEAALSIWEEHPLLGVGLNNSGQELGLYSPMIRSIVAHLEQFSAAAGVRAAAPVHNVYLLILAETGILGLGGFLLLLGAIFVRGLIATAATADGARGLCIGLCVGLIADYLQQLVDFSLWFNSSWYTLALLGGLLGTVPQLRPRIA